MISLAADCSEIESQYVSVDVIIFVSAHTMPQMRWCVLWCVGISNLPRLRQTEEFCVAVAVLVLWFARTNRTNISRNCGRKVDGRSPFLFLASSFTPSHSAYVGLCACCMCQRTICSLFFFPLSQFFCFFFFSFHLYFVSDKKQVTTAACTHICI